MLSLDDFAADIEAALPADRPHLRRLLRSIRQAQRASRPFDRNLTRLSSDLQKSVALRAARRAGVPAIHFDDSLPIAARKDEIAAAINQHQVVVVCGETGSGKSTQLPKICLELGRGIDGLIGHTQPRRIAARSIASRLAQELSVAVGSAVGFKVRFTDETGPQTYIKLMTDGILLAETQADRLLSQYDTIILDEAHERSLNIDFLLGYLQRLLPRRPDLKLIITSATIDAERFAEHFATADGPAPIITVSGRTYPVEVRYEPLDGDDSGAELDTVRGIVRAVDQLTAEGPGDLLVFLATERDIHETAKALRGHFTRQPSARVEILPLYARLSAADQNRVFESHHGRRIVLATNVAESSLTVPNIRYVIDPGTARVSRYSARSKLQRLPIEPISQASADQRAGRCGRVGPGICVRLYSEEDYQARDRFTSPEIQRANLSAVILQTKTLELGDIEHFPLLDPPRPDAVRDGYKTLFEIGALDEHHGLTEFGRQLSRLPIDPRLARVVWAGHVENCLHEVLIITAGLSVQDPRERPTDRQQAADELHARYSVAESDFLGYLKLWDFVHGLRQELSRTQFRKTCRDQFLSFNRLREWFDVHRQLLELTQQAGLRPNHRRDDSKAIHRALLPGFLSNVAQRTEARDYLVAGGHKAQLWPGSSTQSTRPQWVVATEQVELTRRYLRTVGHINPKWIESLAPHLVNRSYSEAHWHRGTGSPMVFEKVTLMGLVLVPRRQVPYGPLDALRARAIFIQHALVEGDFRTWGKFLAHNQELIAEMERLEAKTRRRDLLHEARARYEFYHRKLPADVYDAHRFEAWRRKVEQQSPRFLFMTPADLLRVPIDSIPQQEFPESLSVEDLQLPLAYEFDPDSHSDGITLLVPREGMNKLDRRQLGWLVPGLVEEKVVALIRALPKDVRRAFVPVPDTAQRVMVTLEYGVGDFYAVVARALSEIGREPIRPEWFDETLLPPHLRMNIRVVDAEGKSLAAGRDLGVLRTQLAVEAEAAAPVEPLTAPWLQEKLTSWTIGDLPQQVDYSRAGVKLRAYPALVDRGESAAVQLFDTPEKAAHEHRAGLRRLFQLAAHRELRGQIAWLPHMETMTLEAASLPDHRHLQRRIEDLLTDLAFCSSDLPRSRSEFEERLSQGRDALPAAVQDVAGLLPELFSQFHRVRLALESAVAAHLQPAVADMQSQLDALMRSGFLTSTPWPWLVHYPRYLRGMLTRLDRLRSGGMERDRQAMELVGRRWRDFEERRESHESRQVFDAELERFRWLLEEYRVSLFAQGLGTSQPVSEKRLDRQWARVKS